MSDKITVMNPMGYPPQTALLGMAPRLKSLERKTVYLVECRFDDSDILMGQMQNWFAEHMPEVKTELRSKAGVYTERDPELYDEIKARGDAAVVAVGH